LKAKYVLLSVITPLIIVVDQWTKYLVLQKFRLGETIPMILGFFNLTYIRNTGAAFGLLAQADPSFRIPFFVTVPLIALVAVGYIFRKIDDRDYRLSISLSLVISGAIGNLIDRLQMGYVVDFLDFHWGYGYHFPAFNVADSAICVGVAILVLDLLTEKHPSEEVKTHASSII
jgi:signal peptidase II